MSGVRGSSRWVGLRLALAATVVVAPIGACSDNGDGHVAPSTTMTPESEPPAAYDAALSAIPLDGPPGHPLYWDNLEIARTSEESALVSAVRYWEATVHMLDYSEVPRREADRKLLYLFATEEWAAPIDQHHGRVYTETSDPVLGPQWIRVLDIDATERPATVTLCFDRGYYGRESQGGGAEMFREHRALLVVYSLVPELVPELGERWKVSHERPYAGDDYPEPNTGPDRECKEWANHDLTDVPDS